VDDPPEEDAPDDGNDPPEKDVEDDEDADAIPEEDRV